MLRKCPHPLPSPEVERRKYSRQDLHDVNQPFHLRRKRERGVFKGVSIITKLSRGEKNSSK